MAKMTSGKDQFVNVVYASVTESAANTLTFQKIETGFGSLEKTAWLIERIEWYPSLVALNENVATDDIVQAALTTSNLVSSLTLESSSLVDLLEFRTHLRSDVGFQDHTLPWIRDFSNLAGGGRLVLPYPLFLAAKCTSHTNPATLAARIFFSQIELADNQWVELVEQTRLLT